MANAERDIWAKISVNYFDNPKIDVLSDAAQLLHLSLILLAKPDVDAVLPESSCRARGNGPLSELLHEGLLIGAGDGYQLAALREFRKANRFGILWHSAARRWRLAIPSALREAVYARDGYRCVTCGSICDLTLDHVFPWSLGGPDTYENLQTMCRSCNSKKGARIE